MLPAFVFSPLSAGNKPRRVPNPAGLLYSKPRRSQSRRQGFILDAITPQIGLFHES